MSKLPTWVKAVIAAVLFAVLFGAARFLLYLDRAPSGKVGLD